MSATIFALPEKVNAESVTELHNTFCQQFESCDAKAVIDSAEVCQVDILGLQLLAVLVAGLSAKSVAVTWDNLSIDLYMAADALGLCGGLQLEL